MIGDRFGMLYSDHWEGAFLDSLCWFHDTHYEDAGKNVEQNQTVALPLKILVSVQ